MPYLFEIRIYLGDVHFGWSPHVRKSPGAARPATFVLHHKSPTRNKTKNCPGRSVSPKDLRRKCLNTTAWYLGIPSTKCRNPLSDLVLKKPGSGGLRSENTLKDQYTNFLLPRTSYKRYIQDIKCLM